MARNHGPLLAMKRLTTHKTCDHCGDRIVATLVRAEGEMWRKSLPVLLCPSCDAGPAGTQPHDLTAKGLMLWIV